LELCFALLSLVVLYEAASIIDLEDIDSEEAELAGYVFNCPKPDGLFSHPKTCFRFYHCSNNKPYYKKCPSGLAFHPVSKLCDYVEKTPCYERKRRTYFIHKPATWWAGYRFCKSINQRLVSIEKKHENQYIKNITLHYEQNFYSAGGYWTAGRRSYKKLTPPASRAFRWTSTGSLMCLNDKHDECDQGFSDWCDGKRREGQVHCYPDKRSMKCLQVNTFFDTNWWTAAWCGSRKNIICESYKDYELADSEEIIDDEEAEAELVPHE